MFGTTCFWRRVCCASAQCTVSVAARAIGQTSSHSLPAGEVCLDRDLPNFFHGIRGRLCFIDQTTLVIRGFSYDGQGPGKLARSDSRTSSIAI